MVQSMTGYGKAEALLEGGKLTVEIRSVNGKNAEISIKSSLLPKDREIPMRKKLADRLHRGTIDVFLTWEPNAAATARTLNRALALDYYRQLDALATDLEVEDLRDADPVRLISTLLGLPEVMDYAKRDVITEAAWPAVEKAFDEALDALVLYRTHEGEALRRDVSGRIGTILALEDEVEACEAERVPAVRARILKAAEELKLRLDPERLEQEMVFYLDKYDINEEKVRLRQHCKYFLDTLDTEENPGRKLGFIIQEMGREINTTGSKANHVRIQQAVVRMKDELEKIREQSLNIL